MYTPLTTLHHVEERLLKWKLAVTRALQMLITSAARTGSCVSPQAGVVGNACDDLVAYFLARLVGVPASALERKLLMQEDEIVECGSPAHSHIYAMLLARHVPSCRGVNLVAFMTDPLAYAASWDWQDAWLTSTRLCEFLCYIERFYPEMILSCYLRIREFALSKGLYFDPKASGLLPRIGVLSHLLPYELRFGEPSELLNDAFLTELLNLQHHDGLFYPVSGGGACPDLNAVNLLLFYCGDSATFATAIAALQKFVRAMISHLDKCWQPENYRSGSTHFPAHYNRLPPTVVDWIAREEIGGVSLYQGDVWSTMVRYCALMKAWGAVSGMQSENFDDHYRIWMPGCALC
jgi:hypothetical protein